jgi:hypothetical protein
MKNTKNWLSNAKLRASYGIAGNDNIGAYRYGDLYSLAVIDKLPSIIWSYKGVGDITWETSAMLDLGFEASIKKDRLKIELDYYSKNTRNLLFAHNVPPSLGYTYIYANDGKIRNRGFEWQLTSKVVKTRNIELAVRLNGSFNKSMVLALPHELRFGDNREQIMTSWNGYRPLVVGHQMGEWYMPQYAGVDKDNGQALWIEYYDDSGESGANNNFISDVYQYLHEDKADGSLLHPNAKIKTRTTNNINRAGNTFIGKKETPDIIGGFGFDLSVYGFELSAAFNYQIGGYGVDQIYMQMMGDETWGQYAWHKDMLKAWNPITENYDTDVPALTGGLYDYASYVNSVSDRFLTSNSAFQIANVKIAYYFPKKWIKKALLNSLSVWVSGDNLYSATARKGYFPFAAFGGTNNRSQYLPLSTVLGGIKLQF